MTDASPEHVSPFSVDADATAISAVVPVYNEEDNVLPLITEIAEALSGRDVAHEIIYVDDGSSDKTMKILEDAQSTFPQLRVLRHVTNSGQSTAVMTGIRHARSPWIVTLDGDGQNVPKDIPGMMALVEADPSISMVAGWRKNRLDNEVRRLSSRLGNWARRTAIGDPTPDSGCGLKLFRREEFLKIPFFNHCHRFLPALFIRQGATVVNHIVEHRDRQAGTSKYGVWNRLWVGIVDIIGVMWLQRRMNLTAVKEYRGGKETLL